MKIIILATAILMMLTATGMLFLQGTKNGENGAVPREEEQEDIPLSPETAHTDDSSGPEFIIVGTISPDLPEEVQKEIEKINEGEPLHTIDGLEDLEGYHALTRTHAILARDPKTQEEVGGSGKVTLYVPNLLEGLEEISFLFYSVQKNRWEILPAQTVDVPGKRVTATLDGSGTVTVIYRQ